MTKMENWQAEIGCIPIEWDELGLRKYIGYIKECLEKIYENEKDLIENNLCERCLVFRFAHHLQNKFNSANNNENYFVDCDYNSSCYYDDNENKWTRCNGKPILDQNQGEITKRFIDIIVHKRDAYSNTDLLCFEVKKWNNCTKSGIKKDENNLKILTSQYRYVFGFHLIFGKKKEETELRVIHENYPPVKIELFI
jgi:hypothetical protein